MKPLVSRALGILAGVVADALIADPQDHHPVALFGSTAARIEEHTYAPHRVNGALHTAICLAPLALGGIAVERLSRRIPPAHLGLTALATWAALGATGLTREGQIMAGLLADGDLKAARGRLSHLCGRDPDALDGPELARATIESMAENTSDAAVATIFWGTLAGIPGILVHRGSNTLDAMNGHKNQRYLLFGWAPAMLDDLMDWIPARVTGVLTCLLAPAVGGGIRHSWQILMRDHAKHPSPNGGWCESSMAGVLGVQLGGRNIYYGGRVEDRGLLGDGPCPGADQVRSSTRMVRLVTRVSAALSAGVLIWIDRTRQD